jgi:uncharacterized protein YcfJ
MKKLLFIFIFVVSLFARDSEYMTYKEYKVTHTEPVYEIVVKRVPIQECWEEDVVVEERVRRHPNHSGGDVGGLLGGIAGGIIGNQIGEGTGKALATVGGAIVGSMIGSDQDRYNPRRSHIETRQRCTTRYKREERRELAGYRNYFRLNGIQKYKFSNRKLDTVRVEIVYNY